MAIETREKTIDDHPARCTPHKGRPGARLLARLLRHIGPVLGRLKGVDMAKLAASRDMIGDIVAFAPAIAGLFESLSPDEFDAITVEILSRCSIALPGDDGQPKNWDLSKPANIDGAFEGNLVLMFRVMAWALEVNFAGFFPETGPSAGAGGALVAVTDQPAPQP